MVQTAAYDSSYDNSPITRVALTDSSGQPIPGTGTGTGSGQVQGTAADNAAAVGNPVQTGAVYNTAAPTYANGDIATNQADVNGNLKVTSGTPTGSAIPSTAYFMGASNGTNLTPVRSVSSGLNVTSEILGAGMVAQLDDTTPTSITEDRFGLVRMSSDRSLLTTQRATTPTLTSVAASASSVSLLAANNARKGATITNDSSAVLYIKLGATASTTSYTVTLAGAAGAPFSYYEVPFGYVGAIDGIWASATGNARITEIN